MGLGIYACRFFFGSPLIMSSSIHLYKNINRTAKQKFAKLSIEDPDLFVTNKRMTMRVLMKMVAICWEKPDEEIYNIINSIQLLRMLNTFVIETSLGNKTRKKSRID